MLRKKTKKKSKERIVKDPIPPLQKGINLVRTTGEAPVLQTIVARELTGKQTEAVWADVGNRSSTYELAARDEELLERVFIGRSFTPFQHHELIHELEEHIDSDTEILVTPNFTSLYIEGQLSDREKLELFQESWNEVKRLTEKYDLKLVVTTEGSSEIGFKVELDAEKAIEAEKTVEGWKYSSQDFQTTSFYRKNCIQTTMNYWNKGQRVKR